ncbi:DUF2946 family protein [Azospirillum thiophilum]
MASGRRTVWRGRRLGLVAGMAALLLQVIAWGWMSPIPGAVRADQSTPLLICSAGGLTTIQVDPADYDVNKAGPGGQTANEVVGGPGDLPTPMPSGTGHCPLCPLIAGLALPPPPTSIGPAIVESGNSRPLPGGPIAVGWFLSTLQARAPPLPA